MKPQDVRPKAWTNIEVLFCDYSENFSIIWGERNGNRCFGVRWNEDEGSEDLSDTRGYPGFAGYPTWFIFPNFLAVPVLKDLLTKDGNTNEINKEGIKKAIKHFGNQKKT
jgi:hypothetical protein